VQEEGDAIDREAWNCINEGRWKEGSNGMEGGGERIVATVHTNGAGMHM